MAKHSLSINPVLPPRQMRTSAVTDAFQDHFKVLAKELPEQKWENIYHFLHAEVFCHFGKKISSVIKERERKGKWASGDCREGHY